MTGVCRTLKMDVKERKNLSSKQLSRSCTQQPQQGYLQARLANPPVVAVTPNPKLTHLAQTFSRQQCNPQGGKSNRCYDLHICVY